MTSPPHTQQQLGPDDRPATRGLFGRAVRRSARLVLAVVVVVAMVLAVYAGAWLLAALELTADEALGITDGVSDHGLALDAADRSDAVPGLADHWFDQSRLTPLYSTCDRPGFGDGRAAWATSVLACFDGMWGPVFTGLGRSYEVTRAVPHPAAGGPPCDRLLDDGPLAYCATDGTVRVVADRLPTAMPELLFALAHGHAHHLQGRADLLDAWQDRLATVEPGSDEHFRLQRRGELQATCVAAVTLRAAAVHRTFAPDVVDQATEFASRAASSPTHGSTVSVADWVRRGANGVTVEWCDTWEHPAAAVA